MPTTSGSLFAKQDAEQAQLLGSTESHRSAVTLDLQRSEQPEAHHDRSSRCFLSIPNFGDWDNGAGANFQFGFNEPV